MNELWGWVTGIAAVWLVLSIGVGLLLGGMAKIRNRQVSRDVVVVRLAEEITRSALELEPAERGQADTPASWTAGKLA